MSMESLGALMKNPMAPKRKRRRNPQGAPKGMMEAMRRRVVQKPKGSHSAQRVQKSQQAVFKDIPNTPVGKARSADVDWEKIVSASRDRSNRGFPGPNGARRVDEASRAENLLGHFSELRSAQGSAQEVPQIRAAKANMHDLLGRSDMQEALKRRLKKGKVKPVGHRRAKRKIRDFFNS